MKYITYLFQYWQYFPFVGFVIGLLWGFSKSSSTRGGGAMNLVMSIAIGGAIGLVCGVAVRFFAHYVLTSQVHQGVY